MYKNRLYNQAIDEWGEDAQIIQAIEELSELMKELCKMLREGNCFDVMQWQPIYEEIADVEIMLEQLKYIGVGHSDVERMKKKKLKRLEHKLETGKWKDWSEF
jgi:hypothetical protein